MPDAALPPWEQDKSQDNRPVRVPPAETVKAPGSELVNIDKQDKENAVDGDRELESSSPRAIMQPPPIRALDGSGEGSDAGAADIGVAGGVGAGTSAASAVGGVGGGMDGSAGKRADTGQDKGKRADGKIKLSEHAGMKRITTKRRSSVSATKKPSAEQAQTSAENASAAKTNTKSGGRSSLFRSSAASKKTQAERTSTQESGASVSSRQQSQTQPVTPPWAKQSPGQPAKQASERGSSSKQSDQSPDQPSPNSGSSESRRSRRNRGRKTAPRLRVAPNRPQRQESQSEQQENQSQKRRGLRQGNSSSSRGWRGGARGSGDAKGRQTSSSEASSSSERSESKPKPFARFIDAAVSAADKIVSSLNSLPAAFSGGRLGISSRKGQSVVLLDSNKVIEVQFKAGQVAAISEDTYDSEFDALQSVSKGRGSKIVVWCGYIAARQSRRVEASEHSSVKSIADARYLERSFGNNKLAAMSGEIALAPVPNPQSAEADEISQHLDSMKSRMVVSGMCVSNADGIWLRVGRSIVEATLMHKGRIRTWSALCPGLDSVAENIRKGMPAERARAELAEKVANETRRVIITWQRSHTVASHIWLHGPGGDPAGAISQALLLHSGCRVSPPVLNMEPTGEAMRYITSLPTAMHALTTVQLYRPQDVLKKAGRARRVLVMKIAGAVVAVLIGMTIFANWRGGGIDSRIKALKAEQESLANDADDIRERDRAIAVKDKIAELIDGVGRPNWEEIIHLYEEQPIAGENEDLIAQYNGTDSVSFSVTIPSAGLDTLEEQMENLAEIVYGAGASATVVSEQRTLLDDRMEYQISLKGPSVQ